MKRLTTAIKSFWRKLPKPIRSAWITAWVAFVGSVLTIVTSLLPQLAESFSSRDFSRFYDSLNAQATVAISAVFALATGLVNGIFRWWRPIEQAYRSDPPPAE